MKSIRWIQLTAVAALISALLSAAPVCAAPDFTGAPISGPAPLVVTFTTVGLEWGTPDSVTWDFGDGRYAHDASIPPTKVHTYDTSATYTVTMMVWYPSAPTTAVSHSGYITVSGPGFIAAPTVGATPLATTFRPAKVSGSPDSITWNFGDGGYAGGAGVKTHAYDTAGSFTVSMKVWYTPDPDTTVTRAAHITAYGPGFIATPKLGPAPLLAAFASAQTGTTDSITWNFGDGAFANSAAPSHTYTAAGVYSVTMTMWPTGGGSSPVTHVGYITVWNPDFTGAPLGGQVPLLVTFTPDGVNGTPDSVKWDFGDATPAVYGTDTKIHTYTSAGVYDVVMTVWYEGHSAIVKSRLNYVIAWSPDFTGTPTAGSPGLLVTFTPAGIVATPDSVTWNFGDGGHVNGTGVRTHTYNDLGVFTVGMTAWYPGSPVLVTRANYITISAFWPGIASTSASVSQPSAKSTADSCGIKEWRNGVYKRRWYNYAGPDSTKVPILSFRTTNLSGAPDTLLQIYVHSLNERTSAVKKIYLYRDTASVGKPDTAYYFDGGDALLGETVVSSLFQTNDSILIGGLSNVIAANDTAWYHLVVDMNGDAIRGNSAYDSTGVMVEIRAYRILMAQGGIRSWGPDVDLTPACTPTTPANNGYSIIIILPSPSAVLDDNELGGTPGRFSLSQNYPNPFNSGTVLPFELRNVSRWALVVLNVLGQPVRSFSGTDGPGPVSVIWDGTSDNGATVPTGIYFYRVTAGGVAETKKMVLLK